MSSSSPSPSSFVPVIIEPGPRRPDGRIQDKRDPDLADVIVLDGQRVHREAARALVAMRQAAAADGMGGPPLLTLVSGYRPSSVQRQLWDAALKRYGSPDEARKWVAPPGSSAHESGRALDLHLGLSNSSKNVQALRGTAIYGWLRAHAVTFGFYPYEEEPWHWEYNP